MRVLACLLLFSSALATGQQPTDAPPPARRPGLTPGGYIPVRYVDVLSDTKGLDVTPYLRLNMHYIQRNWRTLTSTDAIGTSHGVSDLALEFTISRDGALNDAKLAQPCGDSVLDQAALEALKRASPFRELPSEYEGQSLALRVRLHYDPNRAGPAEHLWSASGTSGAILDHAPERKPVPKLIYQQEPEFSEEARRKKVEGTISLHLTVSEDGDVTDAVVTKGLGYGLDEKALEAVRRWKFKAPLKDGEPISTTVDVLVNFHLY